MALDLGVKLSQEEKLLLTGGEKEEKDYRHKMLKRKGKIKFDSIRKRSDFKKLYREGIYIKGKYLDIYMLDRTENNNSSIRVGFNISKNIGKAVTRNRIRRILKEIIIKIEPESNRSIDIIFIAKKGICDIGFWDLKDQIEKNINIFYKNI